MCKGVNYVVGERQSKGRCIWDALTDPEFVILCAGLYAHYQNGFLPFDGGILHQPAWLNQVFSVMSQNKADIEDEKSKSERGKMESTRKWR